MGFREFCILVRAHKPAGPHEIVVEKLKVGKSVADLGEVAPQLLVVERPPGGRLNWITRTPRSAA